MPAYLTVLLLATLPLGPSDDREIIQSAMLSFFVHEPWHSADWRPKKHVVLRPQYGSATRKPFDTLMKEAKGRAQQDLDYIKRALPRS